MVAGAGGVAVVAAVAVFVTVAAAGGEWVHRLIPCAGILVGQGPSTARHPDRLKCYAGWLATNAGVADFLDLQPPDIWPSGDIASLGLVELCRLELCRVLPALILFSVPGHISDDVHGVIARCR